MSRAQANLLATFYQARDIFNANTDPTINHLLDDNVTINTYDHNPYNGIAAVEAYFAQEFNKQAKFTPTVTSSNVSGNSGMVGGTAGWTSHSHPNGVTFKFEFKFVYEGNQWLILNMDCYK
jgi:hypothetical protein